MTDNLRVLVAVDASSSVDVCRTLVHLLPARADIRLLTVLSFSEFPHALMGGRLADEAERAESARRAAASAQDTAKQMLADAGFDVTVVHRFGFPPNEIIAELDEHHADVLALGRRDTNGRDWAGSVSDRILRRARVPILLVA